MMTFLTRHPRFLRLFLIGIIVLACLSIAKDWIVKTSIEIVGSKVIGAKLEIRSLTVGLITHKIRIRDLRIENPPGFPQENFLSVPEIAVDLDIPQLLKSQWHFPLIVINLSELIVLKNKEGKLNVDELKVVKEQLKMMKEKKGEPQKLPDFVIDELRLSIGKVVVKDETKSTPAVIQVYQVGLKGKPIRNIDSVQKLVGLVLVEALKPTAIRKAGVFAATALMGVGFLPAAAFGVVIADDDATAELKASLPKVYKEGLALVKDLDGTVKQSNAPKGQIFAKIYGCDILITIEKKGWGKSKVTIKARKYLLAKPQIAAGILYQLMDRLRLDR